MKITKNDIEKFIGCDIETYLYNHGCKSCRENRINKIKEDIIRKNKEIKTGKCYCRLCKKLASCDWWYHSPGDFDDDNLAPLIHLCKKHKKEYDASGYPPPRYIPKNKIEN